MLVALALGLVVGLSLGALGAGGSILTVPVLVYVLGEDPGAATTASLVTVGVAALVATAGHARAGRVHWRTGVAFGALGALASVGGTALNHRLDGQALLLGFSGVLPLAAAAMARPVRRPATARTLVAAGGSADVPAPDEPRHRPGMLLVAAPAVGFLTGLFGVGGGFVVVPVLVVVLGYEVSAAVGTSLLVIALNSAVALAERAGHTSFHWAVIVPFTLAAIAGSLAGRRVAVRVAAPTLTRGFVVLLVAVAAYTGLRSGLALAG